MESDLLPFLRSKDLRELQTFLFRRKSVFYEVERQIFNLQHDKECLQCCLCSCNDRGEGWCENDVHGIRL